MTSCAAVLHVPLGEAVAAAHQAGQLVEHPLGARDVGRLPFDDQLVAAGTDADAELRFEMLEVLVVAAEQRFDALVGDADLADDGGGRYGVTPAPGKLVCTVYCTGRRPGAGGARPAMSRPCGCATPSAASG